MPLLNFGRGLGSELPLAAPTASDLLRLEMRSATSAVARSRRRAPWRLWQYHNRGRVDGIRGPEDLNVFEGDAEAFAAWRVFD